MSKKTNIKCDVFDIPFFVTRNIKSTVNRIYVDVNDTFVHSETKDVHVFFKLCPVLLD